MDRGMKYEQNRQKYVRVQHLINIRLARAYRITSRKALCILTGMTPIILKVEVVKRYLLKGKAHHQIINLDYDVKYRH